MEGRKQDVHDHLTSTLSILWQTSSRLHSGLVFVSTVTSEEYSNAPGFEKIGQYYDDYEIDPL